MTLQSTPEYAPQDRVQWTMATGKVKKGTIVNVSHSEPWIYVVLDDETFDLLGVSEFQLSKQ